jgi:hypothetical protein
MKWNNQKRERFQRTQTGIKGRKNGNVFEIDDYAKGLEFHHLGWYAHVKEVKTDKRFNSLWKNMWWGDIEEAKQWCENFTWEAVK